MAIFKSTQPRGLEPQTQQDIVNDRFPQEGIKEVTLKDDKLPALKVGFESEEQFAKFVLNTMRMRRVMTWQFTSCDPLTSSLEWKSLLSANQSQRLNLEAKAYKIAEIMFTQSNCVGVRVSVDSGIQTAFSAEVPPEDMTLKLSYRPM
jgi:hypothetical protein